MRSLLAMASVVTLGALSWGCAHTLESREDRVVVAVDSKSSAPATEQELVTEAPPVIVTEAVAARPRLARTVTLGEGTTEPVFVTAPRAQGTGQPGVVVNNNITVVGSPPVAYGGYGGYAGYGRSFNSGVGYGMRDPYGRGSGSHSAWAPSGWEGAGRTAAPGHTPGVGGNWSPAPSHGPRQLK